MKIPKAFLLLTAVLAAFGAVKPPHARADVSVSFFYDSLSPYGEWVNDPDYGYVWHPSNVDENWAPYTDGYWAYTDAGWTWVSYEDYGGVVYHYGRWAHVPGEGWVWVPGETWAPAWVSWRSNDDYVGWAPLPPEAHWHAGIGFSTWADARFDIGPGCYNFVGVHDFGAPALGSVIVNREQNITIINNTTNITNITTNNSNVYNGGPNYAKLSAVSRRPIPTLKLVRQGDSAIGAAGGKMLAHQQGNQLVVLAPHVTAPAGGKLPAPPRVARTISAKADNGWGGVKDPQQRDSLEKKFKAETAGKESSPARPVNAEDLRVVNEKIKSQGAAKAETPGETAFSEKAAKVKSGKNKNSDLANLENAPAAEQPGETPKAGKKKHNEYSGAETGEETPKPKKGKKAKTPSEEGYGATEESSKRKSDSNLQPFMGNDEASAPEKSPKHSEEGNLEPKPKKTEDFSSDRTPEARDSSAGEPKAQKSGKGKKKGKGESEDGGFPPGQ